MYHFADLPWGVPRQVVDAEMAGRGFTFLDSDRHGSARYSGRLFNEDAEVIAVFSPAGLVKILLVLNTPRHRAREVYASMQQFLARKYGPPHDVLNVYRDPYREGDGDEELAIKMGKATIASYWPRHDGAALGLTIGTDFSVSVAYESAAWDVEFERRQAAEASIL